MLPSLAAVSALAHARTGAFFPTFLSQERMSIGTGTGIALGLLTALCWGLSDLTVRGASRRGAAVHRTFLATSCASVLWMSLVLVLGAGVTAGSATVGPLLRSGPRSPLSLPIAILASLGGDPHTLRLLILCGALYVLENLLIYRALACAALTLASPIINAWPALTVGLALLAGERPSLLPLVGMAVVFGGVVLLSLQRGRTRQPVAPPIFVPSAVGVATLISGPFTEELPSGDVRFDRTTPQLHAVYIVGNSGRRTGGSATASAVADSGRGSGGNTHQSPPSLALRLTPTQSKRITIPFTALTLPAGIPAAIGACLIQGVELWLLRYAILPGREGALVTSWLLRLEGLALLLVFVAWELIGLCVLRQVSVRRSGWRHARQRADERVGAGDDSLARAGRAAPRAGLGWWPRIEHTAFPAAQSLPRWWRLRLLRAHPQRLLQRGLVLGLIGLFDVGGLTAYLTGLRAAPTALVATMASLSGAVVAIVALAVFRERPNSVQWIGLAAALCGVVLAAQGAAGVV